MASSELIDCEKFVVLHVERCIRYTTSYLRLRLSLWSETIFKKSDEKTKIRSHVRKVEI